MRYRVDTRYSLIEPSRWNEGTATDEDTACVQYAAAVARGLRARVVRIDGRDPFLETTVIDSEK